MTTPDHTLAGSGEPQTQDERESDEAFFKWLEASGAAKFDRARALEHFKRAVVWPRVGSSVSFKSDLTAQTVMQVIALATRAIAEPGDGGEVERVVVAIDAEFKNQDGNNEQLRWIEGYFDLSAVARAAMSAIPRPNQTGVATGLMRAAEILGELLRKSSWDEQEPPTPIRVLARFNEAIRAEAKALCASAAEQGADDGWPMYQPMIVDYPEAGFTELVLMDTLVVWDPPDQNGVEIGYAASDDGHRFSTRVGVRWPLPSSPQAAHD